MSVNLKPLGNHLVVEPIEELTIDTPEEFVGTVSELTGGRKARMLDMRNDGKGHVRP